MQHMVFRLIWKVGTENIFTYNILISFPVTVVCSAYIAKNNLLKKVGQYIVI